MRGVAKPARTAPTSPRAGGAGMHVWERLVAESRDRGYDMVVSGMEPSQKGAQQPSHERAQQPEPGVPLAPAVLALSPEAAAVGAARQHARVGGGALRPSLRPDQVVALQRAAGNQAVGRMLERHGRPVQLTSPRAMTGLGAAPILQRSVIDDVTLMDITEAKAQGLSTRELDEAIDAVQKKLDDTPIVAVEHESLSRNLKTLEQVRATRGGPGPTSKAPPASSETEPHEGTDVQKVGIVEADAGATLRKTPSPDGAAVKPLPFNQRLYVESRMPGDWYRVVLEDGSYGYVAATLVNIQLPEPTARLHKIKGGEGALEIIKQYYTGDAIEWGQDQRFYVNVVVLVNQEARRPGIFKPTPDAAWDDTKTLADSKIWIPGTAFAQSMKGKVSSGSISYEVYQTVKDAAIAAAEFVAGTLAFVAGLLHGALESIWDVFVGLAHLVGIAWGILKSLVMGEIVSDAKALMVQLSKLSMDDLIAAGLGWVDKQWNDPSLLSRWHFRGWITGYAIVEILMLVFSDGIITALKWAGAAAKFSKILSKFPTLAKVVESAKAMKAAGKAEKLEEGLKAAKGAEEAAEAAKAAKAGEAGKAGKAGEAGEAAKAGEALETGADAAKMADQTGELASVFRRGGKIRKVREVSLKQLRQTLGRAGVSPSGYKLQKATAADLAAMAKAGDDPSKVYGWVSRVGSEVVRDSKGRPIINFTPKGLSSLEEAVKTFGHEARHIKDFVAGVNVSSEALAELAGEKLWILVSKTL
jgi:hypothetical protein